MQRWLRIAVVLCFAAATPLVAQQVSSAAPPAGGSTVQPGPRLTPEFRSVQPEFVARRASASPVVAETHTIRMTTLVLILVIVISLLLIAK